MHLCPPSCVAVLTCVNRCYDPFNTRSLSMYISHVSPIALRSQLRTRLYAAIRLGYNYVVVAQSDCNILLQRELVDINAPRLLPSKHEQSGYARLEKGQEMKNSRSIYMVHVLKLNNFDVQIFSDSYQPTFRKFKGPKISEYFIFYTNAWHYWPFVEG